MICYMRNTSGSYSKDYLIMSNKSGMFACAWGKIGGRTLGYSNPMNAGLAEHKKQQKLNSDYKEVSTSYQEVKRLAIDRYEDLLKNFGAGNRTHKSGILQSKRSVPYEEELTVLSRLRCYVELTPQDNKVKQIVVDISRAAHSVEACEILKEKGIYKALTDEKFFDTLVTMNFDFKNGVNPIKECLKQITSAIIKKSVLDESQVTMLRDMWSKGSYTLSQLYYLKYLFSKIVEVTDEVHSPFEIPEPVDIVSFEELNEEDMEKSCSRLFTG